MKDEKKELKEPKKVSLSKKNILIVILGIILVSIVGTFAWFTWRSNETALVLTVGDISSAQVTLKPYKIEAELAPATTYEDQVYTNVSAVNNGTTTKKVSLYYHINNIDTALVSESFKYTITKSTDNGVTYTEYKTGNFSTASNNMDLYIMDESITSSESTKYKVYIWLDGSNPNVGVSGKSFSGELRAEITSDNGPHYMYLSNTFLTENYGGNVNTITFMPDTSYPSCLTADDILDIETDKDLYNQAEYSTNTPDGYEGKIMFYSCPTENGTFDLYIGSTEGKVYTGEDASGFFKDLTNLTAINGMEYFDTSDATNMAEMFSGDIYLESLNLTHFDTSKVTDMSYMFYLYGAFGSNITLQTIDLSSFDTSRVTNMSGMFSEWPGLTTLDLSNFNTSNVTDMTDMFSVKENVEAGETPSLTTINFGANFDTSNVESISGMFYGQKKLTGSFTLRESGEITPNINFVLYYVASEASGNFVINYNSNASSDADYIVSEGIANEAKVVKGTCIDC